MICIKILHSFDNATLRTLLMRDKEANLNKIFGVLVQTTCFVPWQQRKFKVLCAPGGILLSLSRSPPHYCTCTVAALDQAGIVRIPVYVRPNGYWTRAIHVVSYVSPPVKVAILREEARNSHLTFFSSSQFGSTTNHTKHHTNGPITATAPRVLNLPSLLQ